MSSSYLLLLLLCTYEDGRKRAVTGMDVEGQLEELVLSFPFVWHPGLELCLTG